MSCCCPWFFLATSVRKPGCAFTTHGKHRGMTSKTPWKGLVPLLKTNRNANSSKSSPERQKQQQNHHVSHSWHSGETCVGRIWLEGTASLTTLKKKQGKLKFWTYIPGRGKEKGRSCGKWAKAEPPSNLRYKEFKGRGFNFSWGCRTGLGRCGHAENIFFARLIETQDPVWT